MDGSKFDCQKYMVTIIRGIKGFYIIDFLPEGQTLNSEYIVEHLLIPIFEKIKSIWSE